MSYEAADHYEDTGLTLTREEVEMEQFTCPSCGAMFDSLPSGSIECPRCGRWFDNDEGTAYRDATRHLRAANERIRAAVERMRLNQEELERWWAERRRA